MMDRDLKGTAQNALRELGIPALAGVAAAGVGFIVSRKPDPRKVVPDVKGGVGDLVDDLRGKLESVIGKRDGNQPESADTNGDDEFAERRRARRQRRDERRSQSG